MPELWEIGLDPAVQGVPVKKKRSVVCSLWTYLDSGPCPFIPTKAAAAAKSSLFLSMMVVDRSPPE